MQRETIYNSNLKDVEWYHELPPLWKWGLYPTLRGYHCDGHLLNSHHLLDVFRGMDSQKTETDSADPSKAVASAPWSSDGKPGTYIFINQSLSLISGISSHLNCLTTQPNMHSSSCLLEHTHVPWHHVLLLLERAGGDFWQLWSFSGEKRVRQSFTTTSEAHPRQMARLRKEWNGCGGRAESADKSDSSSRQEKTGKVRFSRGSQLLAEVPKLSQHIPRGSFPTNNIHNIALRQPGIQYHAKAERFGACWTTTKVSRRNAKVSKDHTW